MADGHIVYQETHDVKQLSGVVTNRHSVHWRWWDVPGPYGGRLFHTPYCALEAAFQAEVGRASHRAFWGHQPSAVAVAIALLRRPYANASALAVTADDRFGRVFPGVAPPLDVVVNARREGVA
jgi:hypothetical protein